MLHGLLWFPLLILFSWLAWAGWNEYQKVEAYRIWAQQFERAKYDIYAVLGQKAGELTWGKPTRQGPIDLQSFSLTQVRSLQLLVNNQPVDLNTPEPSGRSAALAFQLPDKIIQIPFTDASLAARWGKFLEHQWQEVNNQG